MAQGMYDYIAQAWKKPERAALQERLIQWRASNSIVRVDKPLRLDRARALGYKAKKGFVVLRVRLNRGGRSRPRHKHGRKPRKQYVRKNLKMSYQWVAEIRASRRYKNLEVLNSYYLAKDGKHYFFEVIMVDPARPEIANDKTMKWLSSDKNSKRAERGLTSAARKSRGLRNRQRNLKIRPSMRAWGRVGK